MDYGLKVKDRSEELFTSKYNTLKGRISGSGKVKLPAVAVIPDVGAAVSLATVEVNHNLGYIPLVIVYTTFPPIANINSSSVDEPFYELPMGVSLTSAGWNIYKNKLTIDYHIFSLSDIPEYTLKYRYYIFANKITTGE